MNVDRSNFDWPFYADETGTPKKILYATCNAGLCNRLMVLLSCQRIASRTGRNFAVYWPVDAFKKDESLGCEFNDLFENEFRWMTTDDIYWMFNTYHTTRIIEPPGRINVESGDDTQIVTVKGWYWTHLDGEIPNWGLRSEMLNSLRPVKAITDRLCRVRHQDNAFGVHVRQNHSTFNESTLNKFKEAIDQQLKTYAKFVLVSDNVEVKQDLTAMYGDRCLTLDKIGGVNAAENRSTVEGMRDAVVDLYVLSRFPKILGTQHSTFSECAAFLGKQSDLEWV